MEISPLDFLAAHAPDEIPAWFKHALAPRPAAPPLIESLPEHLRRQASDWVGDPCYDIECEHPELKDWAAAMNAFWAAEREWEKNNEASRYFQWRVHFARNLFQMLNHAFGQQPPAPGEMLPRTTSP